MSDVRSHFKNAIEALSLKAQKLFIKTSTTAQWYLGPQILLEAGLDPQDTLKSLPTALMASVQHALMQNGKYTPPTSLIEWARYSVQFGGGHKFWSVLPHTAFESREQRSLISSAIIYHNTEQLRKLLPDVSFYDKSPFNSVGVTAQFIALTKQVVPNWTPFLTPSMSAITLRTWFPSMPPIFYVHPENTRRSLSTQLQTRSLEEQNAWLVLRAKSGISNSADTIMTELLHSSSNPEISDRPFHRINANVGVEQIAPLHLSQVSYDGFQKQFPHFGWPLALALYAQRSPFLSDTTISFTPSNPMEQQVCVDSIPFLRWVYPTANVVVPAIWKVFMNEKPSNVLNVMMALDEPRVPDINNLVLQYFDRMQNSLNPSINESYTISVPTVY